MIYNRKADMGIGTLILFVAFILVAAVAAGVILQSSVGIQGKALNTGKGTSEEVATSLFAMELYALNASTSRTVNYFYATIKVTSGSKAIKFSDLLITMSTNSVSQDYSYNAAIDCDNQDVSTTSSIYNDSNSAKFGIKYILTDASNHVAGSLYPDETVKICYKAPRAIVEAENIILDVVPKKGSSLRLKMPMPGLMMGDRVYIYP
jgi:flagellin-like protein